MTSTRQGGGHLFFTRPSSGHAEDVYWVDATTNPSSAFRDQDFAGESEMT